MKLRRARFALVVGAAALSPAFASVLEGGEEQESALPLLRGSGDRDRDRDRGRDRNRRELIPEIDLSAICEAPMIYHHMNDFVPAVFFDGSYFSFDHQNISHSFLIGPRGEITASGPGLPANPPPQSLGTFSHYSHISPAATYVNGDRHDNCHTNDKRKSAEIYFIVDRSGETTEISYSFCEPNTCHFHILIGVPEMRLSSFGYDPTTNKFLGVGGPNGRAPFLAQVSNYALCPVETFPDSFLLGEQHNKDPAAHEDPFNCEMDVVVTTDPGTCETRVRKGDYPMIMTRSDEYNAPVATSCENKNSEEVVYELGDHAQHTSCDTFAWDAETRSFQDVFQTKVNVAVVDDEAPFIFCPMIPVDMLVDDTFSPASISTEDNCGVAKVFCSRPIRSRCGRLNFDMFERPTIAQNYDPPEEIGLRPGTYCFMCLAADSSSKDEYGNFIYDAENHSDTLEENREYLYKDGDGEWKSGIPSDADTGLLYSSSRVSRVSEPCLVQVNVANGE